MTIASLLLALVITTAGDPAPAFAGGGDPVLLDFHASWCDPCRRMRPEVAKLLDKQYPIQSIDLDRSRGIAEKYGVSAVPAFLVVDASGRVLARKEGFTPAPELATFYNQAVTRVGGAARTSEARAEVVAGDPEIETTEGREPARTTQITNPKPWETVVRIKIHLTSKEWAYGSGTIIYSDANESIILTCAHIFKDKSGNRTRVQNFPTPIAIDLFDGKVRLAGPNQPGQLACTEHDIPGKAIDYDFDNDVGLIRIQPGRRLPASQVVPESWQPQRGMSMYSVGCSHGNDATAWTTQILEPSVKMKNVESGRGFTEIKCTNEPSQGRSGGGLYTADGYLAGVCDFADPNDHVGLYATPKAIYRLLDRAKLASLYRATDPSEPSRLLANSGKTGNPTLRAQSPSEGDGPVALSQNFTIPPAGMFGITNPETRVASRDSRTTHWQTPGTNGLTKPKARPQLAAAPERSTEVAAVDPGVRPAGPIPSNTTLNNPEASFSPDGEGRDEAESETSPRRAAARGKWKPVQPTPRSISDR